MAGLGISIAQTVQLQKQQEEQREISELSKKLTQRQLQLYEEAEKQQQQEEVAKVRGKRDISSISSSSSNITSEVSSAPVVKTKSQEMKPVMIPMNTLGVTTRSMAARNVLPQPIPQPAIIQPRNLMPPAMPGFRDPANISAFNRFESMSTTLGNSNLSRNYGNPFIPRLPPPPRIANRMNPFETSTPVLGRNRRRLQPDLNISQVSHISAQRDGSRPLIQFDDDPVPLRQSRAGTPAVLRLNQTVPSLFRQDNQPIVPIQRGQSSQNLGGNGSYRPLVVPQGSSAGGGGGGGSVHNTLENYDYPRVPNFFQRHKRKLIATGAILGIGAALGGGIASAINKKAMQANESNTGGAFSDLAIRGGTGGGGGGIFSSGSTYHRFTRPFGGYNSIAATAVRQRKRRRQNAKRKASKKGQTAAKTQSSKAQSGERRRRRKTNSFGKKHRLMKKVINKRKHLGGISRKKVRFAKNLLKTSKKRRIGTAF